MKARRHLLLAGAIATIQICSLIVITDLLGTDISRYATELSSIETVGEEPDLDAPAEGDEGKGEAGIGEAALDLSALDGLGLGIGGLQPPAPGSEDEPPPPTSEPPPPTTVAPPPAGSDLDRPTSTSVLDGAAAAELAGRSGDGTTPADPAPPDTAPPDPGPGDSTGPVEDLTVPGIDLSFLGGDVFPSPSGGASFTTPSTTPSSAASTSSSAQPPSTSGGEPGPTTSVGTGPVPTPTSSDSRAEPTTTATSPPSVTTTTWLPVTTRIVITTWATEAVTSVTAGPTTTTLPSTTSSASTTTTAGTAAPTTPATAAPTTATPTTAAATTAAPTTEAPPAPSAGSTSDFEAIRNTNPLFGRYANVRSDQLDLDLLTEAALRPDNGTVGDGQFRAACQYSHFGFDDPIVFPGQPGRSHLHMFYGNTRTNAHSTTDSLVNSGGSSCNGFELNRSAYWTPALLDGKGNAVVPSSIILYYKTKHPDVVQRMPQGLKMVSGNTSAETFTASNYLFWSCGASGKAYNKSNRIPDCGGDVINASVVFPQCWDGKNLDSADHRSHMKLVDPNHACPSSHPVRLPQISILLYFPGQPSIQGWYLSSDRSGGFNTGPGATLHADWWGAWNDETMDLWTNGCMKRARNCSFGQTGTDRVLARLNDRQNYTGPTFLPLP